MWTYFILFAVLILGLVWLLQVYFLDAFYENMKLKETDKIARYLSQQYAECETLDEFAQIMTDTLTDSDTYAKVETGDGVILIEPLGTALNNSTFYQSETISMRTRLKEGDFPSLSDVVTGTRGTKTMTYACYLDKPETGDLQADTRNTILLYLFSPLFPVRTTVSILRTQLTYITLIALLLALSMAIYLSIRISRPIQDITDSAAKMGAGDYGVQFHGGHYTEIDELADTLTQASRELEKTDMYQKDLIANVSHDLKTPLTMIKSYAEMIRDLSGDDPAKRDQHLNVIMEEADRLNILVNDMLTMSKMQQRVIELDKTVFNITATLITLLTSYEILSEQEGYKFIFNNPGPLLIEGDEARIQQVLSNLINNAVKYCGEDKEVIIVLKKSGRRIRCEVTDHGQGIAPDELSHVWEKYYKSSTHHVRPTEGSGLGLSIVKEILTLHKAKYGVTSKVGKGSTFWFEVDQVRLPRKRQAIRGLP